MKEWIELLKEGDKVLVHSPNFDRVLVKTIKQLTKTRPSAGFEPEKQIKLNNCGTRFTMSGRGIGSIENRRKWITEATQESLKRIKE